MSLSLSQSTTMARTFSQRMNLSLSLMYRWWLKNNTMTQMTMMIKNKKFKISKNRKNQLKMKLNRSSNQRKRHPISPTSWSRYQKKRRRRLRRLKKPLTIAKKRKNWRQMHKNSMKLQPQKTIPMQYKIRTSQKVISSFLAIQIQYMLAKKLKHMASEALLNMARRSACWPSTRATCSPCSARRSSQWLLRLWEGCAP